MRLIMIIFKPNDRRRQEVKLSIYHCRHPVKRDFLCDRGLVYSSYPDKEVVLILAEQNQNLYYTALYFTILVNDLRKEKNLYKPLLTLQVNTHKH